MTLTLPTIEKNVPMPARRSTNRETRGRKLAPWRLFLAGLVAGDSFKILQSSERCIRDHAEVLGIDLQMQTLTGKAGHNTEMLRVWRR